MKPRTESALRPAGFFLLRTPRLPVDAFAGWSAGLAASCVAAEDEPALAAAVARDRVTLRARLRAVLEQPAVREAIYVASPSLAARMERWMSLPDATGPDAEKIENALVRYFVRMTSRPTPFGLFAGFSVGHLGAETRLSVDATVTRHVRIDMEHVVRISERLERDPAIREVLVYRPNPSLYELGGRLHYPELRVRGAVRAYELCAVEPDLALTTVLTAASAGARRRDLAAVLVDEEVTLDDACAFVDELIDTRILESSLTPPLTGDDPLEALRAGLGAGGAADSEPVRQAREALDRAIGAIRALEEAPPGATAAQYEGVASLLTPLAGGAHVAHVFQVDMSRAAQATLGDADVATITRALRALRTFEQHEEPMAAFVTSFLARYEGREVPLMEVLDEEIGVGFAEGPEASRVPAPLVAGLPLRGPTTKAVIPWNRHTRLLARKLEQVWAAKAEVLRLEDEDWLPFAPSGKPFPASVGALVWVAGGGPDGRRKLVVSYTGASAARLVGRFAAWDPELAGLLRAHLRDEEASEPDAIFAEIVHLPVGSRHANLLLRPVLREHEIVFCGRSGAPAAGTITLADLSVSVRGGRVVLRSQRLGRQIVPRLSSAHNFTSHSLGAYRFLAMLQGQGSTPNGVWSWGPFEGAAFLPRVEIGDAILSPRRWSLDRPAIKRLAQSTPHGRMRAAARLREERGLPRYVGLADSDNVLPIDLENTMSVDAAIAVLRRRPSARLQELFLEPAELGAESPLGRHTSEIILPFIFAPASAAKTSAPDVVPAVARAAPVRARRLFGPGSEWLYAKIYCAEGSADHILRACVSPLVHGEGRAAFDRWFFIRYADPESHLRVRLHGEPGRLLADVLPALEVALGPLLASRRVSRFELATYEREIERYGGDLGIEPCERLFWADSEAALRVVEALGDGGAEQDRWLWALLGTDRMLGDFGLDLVARRDFAEAQRVSFLAELGSGDSTEHAIAARFRGERGRLEAVLAGRPGRQDGAVLRALGERSRVVAPVVRELDALLRPAPAERDALVASLVHMWNNRILLTNARAHELVIHTFLARLYASAIARRKG